jgi:hypothetical protein
MKHQPDQHCTKLDPVLEYAQPNHGLPHHIIMCIQTRVQSMNKFNWHNPIFSLMSFNCLKKHVLETGCFNLHKKKHLTWLTPEIELF